MCVCGGGGGVQILTMPSLNFYSFFIIICAKNTKLRDFFRNLSLETIFRRSGLTKFDVAMATFLDRQVVLEIDRKFPVVDAQRLTFLK